MKKTELEKTVLQLKETLETHLRESGEIRTDLKWLKKSYWVIASAAVSSTLATFAYLILHK